MASPNADRILARAIRELQTELERVNAKIEAASKELLGLTEFRDGILAEIADLQTARGKV